MSESQASTMHEVPLGEPPHPRKLDLEKTGEKDGYILDPRFYQDEFGTPDVSDLKTANDGRTVLIPQPSVNPEDPLNWPQWKKTVFLLIISATAFIPDYGSSMGAVTLLPQSE